MDKHYQQNIFTYFLYGLIVSVLPASIYTFLKYDGYVKTYSLLCVLLSIQVLHVEIIDYDNIIKFPPNYY